MHHTVESNHGTTIYIYHACSHVHRPVVLLPVRRRPPALVKSAGFCRRPPVLSLRDPTTVRRRVRRVRGDCGAETPPRFRPALLHTSAPAVLAGTAQLRGRFLREHASKQSAVPPYVSPVDDHQPSHRPPDKLPAIHVLQSHDRCSSSRRRHHAHSKPRHDTVAAFSTPLTFGVVPLFLFVSHRFSLTWYI